MKKLLLCVAILPLTALYSAEPKKRPLKEIVEAPIASSSQSTSTIKYTSDTFGPNLTKLAETRESIISHKAALLKKEKNPKKIALGQENLLSKMMSNVEYSQALLDLALQKAGLSNKKTTIKRIAPHDTTTEELTQRYRSLRNQYNHLDTQELIVLQNTLFDDMAKHATKLLELAGNYISKLKN